jgi:hypothetical protein
MSSASSQTQFKPGNQTWRQRNSHGRPLIFGQPEELRAACNAYFQWVNDNPLIEVELVKYQGEATQVEVPRMRAATLIGLCNFLDIGKSTWHGYRRKPDFSEVTERVESIIYQQKFEGAAAGLLNGNIISRELGLKDRREVKDRDR